MTAESLAPNGVNKKTQSEILYDIVMDAVRELFTDKHGNPYAAIWVNEHIEILPIKGGKFKMLMHKLYYDYTGKPIKSEALNQIQELLESKATYDGNIRDLHIRTSYDKDSNIIYIDLTNRLWQIIKITKDSWSIENSEDMPIMFKRYSNQLAQVEPSKEYPSDIFDQFMHLLNVTSKNDKLLLKCYMVSILLAHIPKPLLILYGEQGAAKTTFNDIVREMFDPSSIKTLVIPRNNTELIQQLSHNYIAYYDNISYLRDWMSDQFCRAVTGSGSSKRELFSDDDDC